MKKMNLYWKSFQRYDFPNVYFWLQSVDLCIQQDFVCYYHNTVPTVPTVTNLKSGPEESEVALTIEWQTPDMPNGNIIGYNIRYWKSENKNETEEEVVADRDANVHTITGLKSGSYTLQVCETQF